MKELTLTLIALCSLAGCVSHTEQVKTIAPRVVNPEESLSLKAAQGAYRDDVTTAIYANLQDRKYYKGRTCALKMRFSPKGEVLEMSPAPHESKANDAQWCNAIFYATADAQAAHALIPLPIDLLKHNTIIFHFDA